MRLVPDNIETSQKVDAKLYSSQNYGVVFLRRSIVGDRRAQDSGDRKICRSPNVCYTLAAKFIYNFRSQRPSVCARHFLPVVACAAAKTTTGRREFLDVPPLDLIPEITVGCHCARDCGHLIHISLDNDKTSRPKFQAISLP